MAPELLDTAGGGPFGPAPAGRVRTPSGRTISADTARRIWRSVPGNTRRARDSRVDLYARWCNEHGRIATDPGTVPDYAAHLAALHHPAETIAAYTATIAAQLAMSGHPLDDEDRSYVRAVINDRSAEEAGDDDGQGDALQATECTREDLAKMLATRNGETVAGKRDVFALTLDWYMAGRASEPASLNLRDVRETVAEVLDTDSGELVALPALVVTLRRSKTNPHGRLRDVVRIVAQGDETCPVAAYRAWREVLDAEGVTSGPLLRRVKDNKLTTAGRPPADPRRAGGIGDRTIRNLIRDCAQAAGLTAELTDEQKQLLSTTAERATLADVADETERARIRTELRQRRRALRRTLPRFSGHSFRRGPVRHLQRLKVPRHLIEQQFRYVAGSQALARYLDDMVPWDDNPTVTIRTAAARATPSP
ncbi:hypothetical protein [Streptomyces chryseus]|uniref:hypothetical protein n=1 Tax=Streptomyces chryseus TaxID=68186 RepID=UPI00110F83D4|nr:hypothetical protein [Streptomyces chryseus]GGX36499.1 hypothetical protein GCM10010353_59480 [Streptomyces chryseus]